MTQTLSAKDAAQLLANGEAALIDVREPEEFKEEHIALAHSMPLSKLDSVFEQLNIPENRKLIFQCLKGKRGENACNIIKAKGTCNHTIYNLEGGIDAWKAAGLPIVKNTAGGLPIIRQVQIIVGGTIALLTALGLTLQLPALFIIAGALGAALCFAGISGWCGLAMLLKLMPWNK